MAKIIAKIEFSFDPDQIRSDYEGDNMTDQDLLEYVHGVMFDDLSYAYKYNELWDYIKVGFVND